MRQNPSPRRTIHKKQLAFALDSATGARSDASLAPLTVVLAEAAQRGDALALFLESGSPKARRARPIKGHYFSTIGVALEAGAAGDAIAVLTEGLITSSRYALIPAQQVYISAATGYSMSNVLDPDSCLYEVGLAVNTTTILLRRGLRVIRG